jgi:hypothetical protein
MTFELWVYAVFSAAVLGLAVDHFRLRNDLGSTKIDLANLRTHVAETYLRSPEMDRLERAIEEQRKDLQKLADLVHELKGALNQNRG